MTYKLHKHWLRCTVLADNFHCANNDCLTGLTTPVFIDERVYIMHTLRQLMLPEHTAFAVPRWLKYLRKLNAIHIWSESIIFICSRTQHTQAGARERFVHKKLAKTSRLRERASESYISICSTTQQTTGIEQVSFVFVFCDWMKISRKIRWQKAHGVGVP